MKPRFSGFQLRNVKPLEISRFVDNEIENLTFVCSLKCVSMRLLAKLADSFDGASIATDSTQFSDIRFRDTKLIAVCSFTFNKIC